MTTFDVDLEELRRVVTLVGGCQRALLDLAADIRTEHDSLHGHWQGMASDAHSVAYGTWRTSCADMVTALAALRGLADSAECNYRSAADLNVSLWQRALPQS